MASTTLTNTKIKETYVGVLHSNGAVLPSTGQQDIYDGGGNKSSIKIGRACNGVTICGPLSCSSIAIGNPTLLINLLYPINSIFLSTDNTNPGTRFVGTTWSQISQGRFLAGQGTGNDGTTSYTVGLSNFNGEYRHTLTEAEMPSHTHSLKIGTDQEQFYLTNDANTATPTADGRFRAQGPTGTNDGRYAPNLPSTGGGGSHNNIPPGFGIYVWKRTA